MKIGIMGALGSFTEQAALQYTQQKNVVDSTIVPLVEITAVLQAIETGAVDLVVFPIQNSLSGIVESSMHGMSQHIFTILDFFEMEVNQNLLVLPGTTSAQINQITSQRPAIGQCTSYLERVWPGTTVTDYVDTAKAAADLANGTLSPDTAVIASTRAAELYNLDILEPAIQDLKHNVTSFVAAVKGI
jgi:prephenate dehydratase